MSTRSRLTIRAIILLAALCGASGVILWQRPARVARPDVHRTARKPPVAPPPSQEAGPPELRDAPPEVREFLGRVLEKMPKADAQGKGFRLVQWSRPDKPAREAVGTKPVPGLDPGALIARVMDVDGYVGHVAHVDQCRSLPGPEHHPPARARFLQVVDVPGIAKVQQVLVLVDAGTIQGRRFAYWYLLKHETDALDHGRAARSAFNVGAWFATPGSVSYALSCWPRRDDVNALQWAALTKGADALAKRLIERTIDGMADWAQTPAAKRNEN